MKKIIEITPDDRRFISDLKAIVSSARQQAYHAVNLFQVASNWLIGQRIVEQEQSGKQRAEYGKHLIELASETLTTEFGKGYGLTQIKNFRRFYLLFKDFNINSFLLRSDIQISQTVSDQFSLPNLSWSHYERLLRVNDQAARDWYMYEAASENWSVRTLDRNIGTQYYYRLLQTPDAKKEEVISEMNTLTGDSQYDCHNFLRNPVIAEFLGFSQDSSFSETNLESAIIDHLQNFILELGKGYAFVARQQRIKTDVGDYYIDLVFYNYILKCFLLIDLKTTQITHSDIGQMDMYIRMYDELKCTSGDNPTIGLLLCSETSKDLARYSILKDSKQLYAAKYLTYLPSEEQLIKEIERQKEIFALQTGKYTD